MAHRRISKITGKGEVKSVLKTKFPVWVKTHRQETDFQGTLKFGLMLAHHANDNYIHHIVQPGGFYVYKHSDLDPRVIFCHFKQSALFEMHELLHRNILKKMPSIGNKTELVTAANVGPQLKDVALLVDITHPHVRATFIAACKFQRREFATTTWFGPLPESTHWLIEVPPDRREHPRTTFLPMEHLGLNTFGEEVTIEPTIESVTFHERHGPLGPHWQTKNW